jgi:hypothetical protein
MVIDRMHHSGLEFTPYTVNRSLMRLHGALTPLEFFPQELEKGAAGRLYQTDDG